ncbi:pre-peptidase C-terminal domain-containing protein [Nitrosomonas marina]|uniref:Pre-peptidase C-terminal domain-containing protein n=2 Tax=Nitrosomonas marina TaxID=917 RepID=A0A1I0F3P6_9PROT|nr:pre-peptidase C-terminal domain-containing protein [Nitrosomonas marina]
MLYSFPAEWTVDGFHTEPNNTLSDMDKAFIASTVMYPGKTSSVVELPVAEIKAFEASIGQPGEEDLFTFTARSTGTYIMETEGQTDLVMKLFGPDNQTQLVAEDDDGGNGFNPRITADLASGKYYLQVRHYNRSNGTGPYGIKVYKS